MADYLTARAAIAGIIDAVTIQAPAVAAIERVYETRPDGQALDTFPCVLITGYTSRYLRGAGKRERQYVVGLRLAVMPGNNTTMHAILEAFKEAIGVAFDARTTLGLGGNYHVVEGPNWTMREPIVDGGATWDEGELVISIKDAASFGA